MCRSPALVCTALGADSLLWPTTQPLPTPQGAMQAAHAVSQAVSAAQAGDAKSCRVLLQPLEQQSLQDWFHDHAQNASRFRAMVFQPQPVIAVQKDQRDRAYPQVALEREIFQRDEGKCRYCGIPVQLRQDLRKVNALVGEDLFAMGRTNRTRSGAMIVSRASADHIIPVTQGGRTTPENLVTACWPCQFGKSSFTPEQVGITSTHHEFFSTVALRVMT